MQTDLLMTEVMRSSGAGMKLPEIPSTDRC